LLAYHDPSDRRKSVEKKCKREAVGVYTPMEGNRQKDARGLPSKNKEDGKGGRWGSAWMEIKKQECQPEVINPRKR